jgi:hypothetical protein
MEVHDAAKMSLAAFALCGAVACPKPCGVSPSARSSRSAMSWMCARARSLLDSTSSDGNRKRRRRRQEDRAETDRPVTRRKTIRKAAKKLIPLYVKELRRRLRSCRSRISWRPFGRVFCSRCGLPKATRFPAFRLCCCPNLLGKQRKRMR